MIEVEQLSKSYGPREAIKDLSFQIEKGGSRWVSWTKWCWEINDHEYSGLHYACIKWHRKNLWVRHL